MMSYQVARRGRSASQIDSLAWGMGALRHASLICILMIAMLSVALLAAGSKTIDVSEPLDGPVQYGVHSRVGFLTQLPVLIFAYTCNMNVPIFYGSLRFNYKHAKLSWVWPPWKNPNFRVEVRWFFRTILTGCEGICVPCGSYWP